MGSALADPLLKPVLRSMLLVTGGAGFIGSNVVASLNETGRARYCR